MKKAREYLFSKDGWKGVILIFFVFVAIIFLIGWPISSFLNQPLEKIGSFGDSFGALTALFSGLAFWVALYLLREQKNEFSRLVQQTKYSASIQRAQLQPQFKIDIEEYANDGTGTLISFSNQNDQFFNLQVWKLGITTTGLTALMRQGAVIKNKSIFC